MQVGLSRDWEIEEEGWGLRYLSRKNSGVLARFKTSQCGNRNTRHIWVSKKTDLTPRYLLRTQFHHGPCLFSANRKKQQIHKPNSRCRNPNYNPSAGSYLPLVFVYVVLFRELNFTAPHQNVYFMQRNNCNTNIVFCFLFTSPFHYMRCSCVLEWAPYLPHLTSCSCFCPCSIFFLHTSSDFRSPHRHICRLFLLRSWPHPLFKFPTRWFLWSWVF